MKNYLGRLILLVEDYEPALQFYQKNFEFENLFDITTSVGQRFLHIGTNSPNAMGIWFLKAEGKEQKERIGKQTAGQPTLVIYTTSLSELYDKLKLNNVRIKIEPVLTPQYKFFHCYDPYGNEIVVVEVNAGETQKP